MAWRIEFNTTARTQLRRLDRQTARRIIEYMEKRVATLDNPRDRGHGLTGPLGGLWRYRIGSYRAVCEIQDEVLRVLVVRVGERDQVYR